MGETDQPNTLPADDRVGFSRRNVVAVGALTAGAVAISSSPAFAASTSGQKRSGRIESSFDLGWLFLRGDAGSTADSVGFDDHAWRHVDLPHDWSIEDLAPATVAQAKVTSDSSLLPVLPAVPAAGVPTKIGPFDFADSEGQGKTAYVVGGIGWYRKHFATPAGRRVELRFDGIFQNSDVWINGVHLGFHPYGFTAITYDLTPHLRPGGSNVIAVKVDNSGKTSRFYSGSGIYQHSWLTVTEDVRIPFNGVFVTTPVATAARAHVAVAVEAANLGRAGATVMARVSLLRHGRPVASGITAKQHLTAGASSTSTLSLTVGAPSLWSPSKPALYTARVELLSGSEVVDVTETAFGIRTVDWSDRGLRINGELIRVRGANLHSTHGPLGAVALNRAEERDIELLKSAGFNSIRTAHNPVPQAKLDACDRLGIVVFDEFTDMWDVPKNPDDYAKYYAEWWERDLTMFIRSDRNHPSVVTWSIGNEIPSTAGFPAPTPLTYGPKMKALIRTLDTSRAITQGAGPLAASDDPEYTYVDVMDFHYDNSYPGITPATAASLHALHPTKAVTKSESWSTTLYADWKLTKENPWFVGAWVWTGMDYLGESGVGQPQALAVGESPSPFGSGNYPWFVAYAGDLDLIGGRKPQNFWRSVVYGTSPLEMLVERPTADGLTQTAALWSYYDELESWTWDVPAKKLMKVRVYTSGDSVTLSLNGVRVAENQLVESDQMSTVFEVPYQPGTLVAVARRNGHVIGRKTLQTAGAPAALELSTDASSIGTGRDDLAHLTVQVVDEHGVRVPDATVDVEFATTGAGRVLAAASGNPQNVDSFHRSGHFTWHGRALAIVQPTGHRGEIRVTARAAGLKSAWVSLSAS